MVYFLMCSMLFIFAVPLCEYSEVTMSLREDGLYRNLCLLFCTLYAASFLVFYYVPTTGSVTGTLIGFITRFLDIVLPLLAATVLFLSAQSYTLRHVLLLRAPLLTLPRLCYLLPYYYLYFFSSGYDTLESLPQALLAGLTECLLIYLYFILLTLLMRLVYRRSAQGASPVVAMRWQGPFALQAPCPAAALAAAAIPFLYQLGTDVADTVSFLIKNGSSYDTADVLTLLLCYLFDLAVLLASCLLMSLLRCQIIRRRMALDRACAPSA